MVIKLKIGDLLENKVRNILSFFLELLDKFFDFLLFFPEQAFFLNNVTVFSNFSSPSNLNVFTRPEVTFDACPKRYTGDHFLLRECTQAELKMCIFRQKQSRHI